MADELKCPYGGAKRVLWMKEHGKDMPDATPPKKSKSQPRKGSAVAESRSDDHGSSDDAGQ